MSRTDHVYQALLEALGGRSPVILRDANADIAQDLAEWRAALRFHGIAGAIPASAKLPEPLLEAIAAERQAAKILALARHEVLATLTGALHAAGIEALALKGARLAYTVYSQPWQRPSGDIDLLIRPADLPRARKLFRTNGFVPDPAAPATFAQTAWVSGPHFGQRVAVDLHTAMSSAPVIAAALSPDPFAAKVRLDAIGADAWGTDGADTLMHLALNRAAHLHFGYGHDDTLVRHEDRLGWLVDADRLARGLAAADWTALCTATLRSGLHRSVGELLQKATDALHTPVPQEILAKLADQQGDDTALAYYAAASEMQRVLANVRALPARNRLSYARLHLFPPRTTVMQRHPDKAGWPLPALYAFRLARGVRALWRGLFGK